jgi:SAM-dependent methyltransferase
MRRDRAAALGDAGESLWQPLAEEVTERLSLVQRSFREALVLGCGGSDLPERLRNLGMYVVSSDAGFRFPSRASGIQCDEDRLPFGDGRFDLIVSLSGLDSVNDLPGALLLVRRALRPDGLFLATFAGAGSLPRLRSAMFAADAAVGGAAPRIHPQIDVRTAGDLLSRAGFALPVVDSQGVWLRYSSLAALVRDLRSMGATNVLNNRSKRAIVRLGLSAAMADFADHADPDGKTAERLELIHLTAWAPSPDQPQPARRGSGTQSLAAALRKPSE